MPLLAGCGADGVPGDAGSSVTTLAKVEGWADGAGAADEVFGWLEVAHDEATAQRLWDDVVPAGLPAGEGTPTSHGRYGDLGDVDLDARVLAVWSSGESGSCPAWITDARTDEDGVLLLQEEVDLGGGDGCTDDYNPYRMVLALDRDLVPPPEQLPSEDLTVPGRADGLRFRITAYGG